MSMILIFVHGMTEGRGLTSAATLTVAAPDPGSMCGYRACNGNHAELWVELGDSCMQMNSSSLPVPARTSSAIPS